jgi:hypothetical protein
VASQRQIRIEATLERYEAKLLEPARLLLGERLVDEIRQRGSPPQVERPLEHSDRAGVVPDAEQLFSLGDKARKQHGIDIVAVHPKQVTGRTRDDPVCTQNLPQGVHVHLERGLRGRRRRLAPDGVDQLVQRDDLVEVERKTGQHSPYLSPAECKRLPVAAHHFERTEDL